LKAPTTPGGRLNSLDIEVRRPLKVMLCRHRIAGNVEFCKLRQTVQADHPNSVAEPARVKPENLLQRSQIPARDELLLGHVTPEFLLIADVHAGFSSLLRENRAANGSYR
jgi:hypothetical protein